MAQFTMEIAGRAFRVHSLFESTRDYCRAYLTEKEPDFSVEVTRADLEAEQSFLRREAQEEGLRIRQFPEPFLERSVIQRKAADRLLEYDVLMLHGSTVAVDGEGYLFTAKCGTGKSTHTRFWRETFGSRAVMVNDDKPFVRITADGVLVCGAPWSGKHGLDTNITVPLKGICILQRGDENRIWRISPQQAEAMVRKQSHCPQDCGESPAYERLIKALLERAAFYTMHCTKDPQAAQTAYEAMSGKEYCV